jgi:cysteine desulfurase
MTNDVFRVSSIYLDYAATTPVDTRVVQKMMACLSFDGIFGNPASPHIFGLQAKEKVEVARKQVADLIHTVPRNIVFTSGATEANNLAIKGIARQTRGKHIITSKTEHKAVLDVCGQLEKEGFEITYLDVLSNGLVDIENLKAALRADTVLVSVMQVNNETGVIQDIKKIGEITRERGIMFHVDAAQSLGKIDIDLENLSVDLMSFSAHKLYGPKGIGALYVGDKARMRLQPEIQGGRQERNMRAGTLATHQIVGFGEACGIAGENIDRESAKMSDFRARFWKGLQDLPGVVLNSDFEISASNIVNICFKKNILSKLKDLAVSKGSACNTLTIDPSHVLRAMGLNHEAADSSIRFSFGRFTTESDIDKAISMVREKYNE